jgi:hypothetical protein
MKTYDVVIEHLVSYKRCIRVTASTEDEAIELAKAQFEERPEEEPDSSELDDVIVHDVTEA